MGTCSCVSNIEEQIALSSPEVPNKYQQEVVESELIDLQIDPIEESIQALVRSYFSRKHFLRRQKKRASPVSTSVQIDIRPYLGASLLSILQSRSDFDYLLDGELINLNNNQFFFSPSLKNPEVLTEGLIFSNESFYKGQILNYLYEGRGTLVKNNGDVYVGSFRNGNFHGEGDLNCPKQKFRYSGSWHDGEHSGRGTEFYPDGSVCVATYEKGVKKGSGVIEWLDGSKFQGSFHNDQIEGNGQYSWNDGRVYEGAWKDGKMHGKGILKWPDGRVYEGEFVDGLKEGFGVYCWAEGKRYEGTWKMGKQHGIAFFYEKGKRVKKGEWKFGKRIRWIE
jgi:hypothetical protein